jgi:hypothetical protein
MTQSEQGASLATPVQGAQKPSITMRVAVVLREELEPWQRLNVTAFTISGVASRPVAVGQDYLDASGNRYLSMFHDPVLVFGASAEEMARTVERARSRELPLSMSRRRSRLAPMGTKSAPSRSP